MQRDKRIDNILNYNKNATREQRQEAARLGGIARGKKMRERKQMRETLNYLMSLPLEKGKAVSDEKIKNIAQVNGKNLTTQQAILLAQIQKAMNGDTGAFLAIRDTLGEKPENTLNIAGSIPVVIGGEDELE